MISVVFYSTSTSTKYTAQQFRIESPFEAGYGVEDRFRGQLHRNHLPPGWEADALFQELHNPLLLAATPSALPLGGSSNIAYEILSGTDESLEAHEFMAQSTSSGELANVTSAMERSRGI